MQPLQLLYLLVYIPDFIGHVLTDNSYQARLLKDEVVKIQMIPYKTWVVTLKGKAQYYL
jgi:hypothetical protein